MSSALDSEPSLEIDGADVAEEVGEHYVGQYRLCFELASGGMATVYLGRAQGPAHIERIAAIKRIHPHLSKERAFVDMFLDEARIVSQINHANVCTVFDFGEAKGEYYIAMEYLVGETLSRVVKTLKRRKDPALLRPLPAIAARIVADACEGLHAAHELRDSRGEELGVVHRDVSPQNLFVTYDGVTKVVDFGVALARERLHQTTTGHVKGKHGYMAPEQLGGAPIDRRADVWSLGVLLWELLTLQPLFKKRTEAETILSVINGAIDSPSQLMHGIPPQLDRITLRALSRDPEQRYSTARELGRDLMRATASIGEPVGLAEVADFMAALFPEGAARKHAMIDFARRLSGPVARLTDGDSLTGSSGAVEAGAVEPHTVPDAQAVAPRGATAPARGRGGALIVVGALLLFSVALLIVLSIGRQERGVVAQVTATLSAPVRAAPDAAASQAAVVTPPAEAGPVDAALAEAGAEADPGDEGDDDGPEKTRRTHSPARGWGSVSVATPGGWADVFEGGRRLGQTPLRVKLAAGRHTLRLRPFGKGPDRSVSVSVTKDGDERVRVPVSPGG